MQQKHIGTGTFTTCSPQPPSPAPPKVNEVTLALWSQHTSGQKATAGHTQLKTETAAFARDRKERGPGPHHHYLDNSGKDAQYLRWPDNEAQCIKEVPRMSMPTPELSQTKQKAHRGTV